MVLQNTLFMVLRMIAIHGPRAVGKSTLLTSFAASRGADVLDLDNAGVRDAVMMNPELAVGAAAPVCIDEYQKAPMVLDAIKSRLNTEGSIPGTAVITGSTRHDALPRTAQALTGRLHVMTLLPFSQGELEGTHENFLEAFFADPGDAIAAHPASTTNRDTKLGEQTTSKRETVENHLRLLEDLFLVQRLDAWGTTLRARALKHPKLHVIDSGLAARLMRVTADRLSQLELAALTEFGNLLETFVVGELRKQASWMEHLPMTGHWRTHDGDVADLVIEHADGRVAAFEVKADERVPGDELKGLRKLRDALGDEFVGGVAFSTGKRSYTYEPKIHVCPVDRLWRTV